MKTLVTGATGFIGSTIVRELLNDGAEVRVTARENSDTRNIDGLDVEVVEGDTRDRASMRTALKGCDTLYHVAAYFAHWSLNKNLFYEVNVEGTKNILAEALSLGLEKVVYTSTSNTIGSHGAGNFVNEEAEFNAWETGDHYAISKYLAEIEAKKICDQGLPMVIVNPTLVIGVRDIKPTPSGKLIIDIANREMPGYIDGAINIIDVQDVARGHLLAAEKGRIGERYILGNENVTVGDFFRLVAEIAEVKPPRLKLPYPVALLLGHIFEIQSRITKETPVVSLSQVRIGNMGEHFDNSKAVNELGLTITPIRTTVKNTVDWFIEHGYIHRGA
ncbi:MAG: NAD-dependent epimerase/dehydratase family protein [Deltaproteobacteria bacterium]|nr:NAD-dependent epimerase/dehydratase family protein [Candidatus Zymogenaceae bacterium]